MTLRRIGALTGAVLAVLSLATPSASAPDLAAACDLRSWYEQVTPQPVGYWPGPITSTGGFASVHGQGRHLAAPVALSTSGLVVDVWLTVAAPGSEVRPFNLFDADGGQVLLVVDGAVGRFHVSVYGPGGTTTVPFTSAAARTVVDGSRHHLRLMLGQRGPDIAATLLVDGAVVGTRTLRGNRLPSLDTLVVPEMARRGSTFETARDVTVTVSHVAIWGAERAPLPCT